LVVNGNLVPISIPLGPNFESACIAAGGAPFGPTAALLGTVTGTGTTALGNPLRWTDETGNSQPVPVKLNNGTKIMVNVTETPKLGDTEEWKIYNFTVDGHPIHMHLVRFEVVSRTNFDGTPSIHGSQQPREDGYKDTVIAYPAEITTVKAKFDIPGLYVWHCHIVEHEDNEMMRPYVVSAVPPPPHHHDFDDRDRDHHKMKHEYRWAAKHK
jgi:spore coat protein A, manganese oxidase